MARKQVVTSSKNRATTVAPGKKRVTFDDDALLVEDVDRMATSEGCTRSDMYRRAMRLFLSHNPTWRTEPQVELQRVAA